MRLGDTVENGGRSAFPVQKLHDTKGLSKREYAAILLKVPESGVAWLDDMIRKSNNT